MENKIPQLSIWEKFDRKFRSIVKPTDDNNIVEETLKEIE